MRISDVIRQIADKGEEIYSQVGVIQAVNREKSTCDVIPINGDAPILNVRFQASLEQDTGFILEPQLGSEVVVCFLDRNSAFIANTSQLEQIHCYLCPQENPNNELTFDINSKGTLTRIEEEKSVSEMLTTGSEINLTIQEKKCGKVHNSSTEENVKKLKMKLEQEQLNLVVGEGTDDEINFRIKSNSLEVKLNENSVLTFDKNGFHLKSEKEIFMQTDAEVKLDCKSLNVNNVLEVRK